MRKLLLLAVAFLLLAAPAWAATTGTATCTVDITTVESLTVTGSWSLTVDSSDDYTNGVWTTTGPVDLTGYANYQWEIEAQITTDWAVSQGWVLALSDDSGTTWDTVTTTAMDFIENQAPNGSIAVDVDAKVTSLEWGDVDDVCTVTFTLSAED